jgi:threonine synthase
VVGVVACKVWFWKRNKKTRTSGKVGEYLKCVGCGERYSLDTDLMTCPKHDQHYGYLEVEYGEEQLVVAKNVAAGGYWSDYLPALPFSQMRVTFGERATPLFDARRFGALHGLKNLFIKDESRNPTGSFKDRHSFCVINRALEQGVDKVHLASSGNAAYSGAAYARRAGIPCLCAIPESTCQEKKELVALSGGTILEHPGNFEETYRAVCAKSPGGWNSTPGINPFSEEGVRIIGYEIFAEIGVPDVIIVPCGNGSLLSAIHKAFRELRCIGAVDRYPRMIGVQIRGAAPLKVAFESDEDFICVPDPTDSIAEAIVAAESFSSPKVMLALRESGGAIVDVDDEELFDGLFEIMESEGIIPEPSSASVYAAVDRLKSAGLLESKERVVVVNTAGGMKNAAFIAEMARRRAGVHRGPGVKEYRVT